MCISWLSYLINFGILQLHYSQKMADYNIRCLWCREDLVPLKADEHPGGAAARVAVTWNSSRDFVCASVWERMAHTVWRHVNRECKYRKWGSLKYHFCFCFCDLLWTVLLYVLPIRNGPFLLCPFQARLTWLCARVLFLCVRATNLRLLFVKAMNMRGFLPIFLSASKVQGLILWTHQTIWSLQSYDVLRRMGWGCFCFLKCQLWPWKRRNTRQCHIWMIKSCNDVLRIQPSLLSFLSCRRERQKKRNISVIWFYLIFVLQIRIGAICMSCRLNSGYSLHVIFHVIDSQVIDS